MTFQIMALLYKTTIMKNIVTMFGAESRHTKTGNAIVFSKQKVENLIKMHDEKRIRVSELASIPTATNIGEGSEGSQYSEGSVKDHLHPHGSTIGEGSEESIEGPPSFIEVYRGIEANRIELLPSICSQIRHNYSKDSTNVNTQEGVLFQKRSHRLLKPIETICTDS